MKLEILPAIGGFRGQLAVLFAAGFFASGACAKEIPFDRAFNDKGEPASLEYEAVFVNQSGQHQLQVWRDGQHRLKRRTDDSIETYIVRTDKEAEYRMSILDLKKKINTTIDRTSLYKIGNFTDWFDLGHGLRHPKGTYQLTTATAPEHAPKAIEACKWYDLTQQDHTSHICWSDRLHLPLLMISGEGQTVWQVSKVSRKALPASTFIIHDEGFIRNDANRDIEPD